MKTTIETKESKLFCYASGSGAISFNWASKEHPFPSVAKDVTLTDVKRYVNLKGNKHLLTDHRISDKFGQIELIPIVERLDKYKLKYKGEEYIYSPAFNERDGKFWRPQTKILFDNGVNDYTEVKNLSIRAALLFFLENESNLYSVEVGKYVIAYNLFWNMYQVTIKDEPGTIWAEFKPSEHAQAVEYCQKG